MSEVSPVGPAAASMSRRRFFLHVGAPKTGTTYLQNVLWANRLDLARAGLLYPGQKPSAHHDAALDLRDAAFNSFRDGSTVDAWDALMSEAAEWDGDVLVSSELLAWARPVEVARAVTSLADAEVHVVFTARDLARQIPAVWQEEIKNRRVYPYAEFLSKLADESLKEGPGDIWGGQDPRIVLSKWGAGLDPAHVHVVTVPPAGSPPNLLWPRFASVFGLEADAFDSVVKSTNVGLGSTEAELLRRVNLHLGKDLSWPQYARLVKHGIAESYLLEVERSSKVPFPPEFFDDIVVRTEAMNAAVKAAGYDVVGSLDDLVPSPPGPVERDPFAEADMVEASVATISGLLRDLASERRRSAELAEELAEARGQLGLDVEAPADDAPGHAPVPEVVVESTRRPVRRELPIPDPRHDPSKGEHVVFMYVGAPLSGISQVRQLVLANPRALAQAGVQMAGSALEQFFAAHDLRGESLSGEDASQVAGSWAELAERVREGSGTWLVCHEQFATATSEQVARAVADLAPARVHVIYTARDTRRQIPAEWTQHLLHRGTRPFNRFVTAIHDNQRYGKGELYFWRAQDPVAALASWAEHVPAERIHVVTVPATGDDGFEIVWRRVSAAIGLDAEAFDFGDVQPDPALGPFRAELLRRFNLVAADALSDEVYNRWVRERLAKEVLVGPPEEAVALPRGYDTWAAAVARNQIERLSSAGYDIVGDLDELVPTGAGLHGPDLQPDSITEPEFGDSVMTALADLVDWLARTEPAPAPPRRPIWRRVAGRAKRTVLALKP